MFSKFLYIFCNFIHISPNCDGSNKNNCENPKAFRHSMYLMKQCMFVTFRLNSFRICTRMGHRCKALPDRLENCEDSERVTHVVLMSKLRLSASTVPTVERSVSIVTLTYSFGRNQCPTSETSTGSSTE